MELRLYSFVNFYLSSMQQGIQTGHVAVDLVRKYTANGNPLNPHITEERERLVEDWADLHKTFIVLNGGNAEGITAAAGIIARSGFPWAIFCEDEASLRGIQTCVAVVLPESVFNARPTPVPNGSAPVYVSSVEREDGGVDEFSFDERHPLYELIGLLRSSRLAS
jgi:hypothetical protein